MKLRWAFSWALAVLTLAATGAFATTNTKPLKIGVIVDISGIYSGIGGPAGVAAVRMAVRDFGGKALGRPIGVLYGDYQNKVAVTVGRGREWYDRDEVAMVSTFGGSVVAYG
jgi:branched-chain amino acid transport system substrate-binding protein